MSIFDSLKQTIARARGKTLSRLWPAWETTVPQYPAPSPYQLARTGYRFNELVFSCISKRADAISEATLRIYDDSDRASPEEVEDHPLRALIAHPNDAMGETEFWSATEIYVDTAGFAVWECEVNRLGEPLKLWPLRPDWCSFQRGNYKPLEYVIYRPPGEQESYIPAERCLILQEFDPLFPMLRGLSRTAVALRVISVDNANTDFLKVFFQNGAIVNGLLKTDQNVDEASARALRRMWMEQHGGIGNWGAPAILGKGLEYQQLQMSMRDMSFPDLDARSEARICSVFDVPAIMVGAKIGLDRATYSNYKEARLAFYQGPVTSRWRWYSSEITQQLLPLYGGSQAKLAARFDTADVEALQEDRTARWARAIESAKAGLTTRDEAREEMGLDPVDNKPVFIAGPDVGGEPQPAQAQGVPGGGQMAGDLAAGSPPIRPRELDTPTIAQTQKALRNWRKQAADAIAHGEPPPLLVGYEHMHDEVLAAKTPDEMRAVFDRYMPQSEYDELIAALREAAAAVKGA